MVPRRAPFVLAALVSGFLVLSASLLLIGRLDAAPATPATTVVLDCHPDRLHRSKALPMSNYGGRVMRSISAGMTPRAPPIDVLSTSSSIYPPSRPARASAGAKLRLFQQAASGADPYWVWPWTAPGAWSEGNITWNNQPWPAYPNAATVGLTLASGTWQEWDVSPIVQDWIQAGKPNYGIVLAGDSAPQPSVTMSSIRGWANRRRNLKLRTRQRGIRPIWS